MKFREAWASLRTFGLMNLLLFFFILLFDCFSLATACEKESYALVILVDAYHLDYSGVEPFFRSVAKNALRNRKRVGMGGLGHAWIRLEGEYQGEKFILEGGHSGERETSPPGYFDGIMNYSEWGYAEPTAAQKRAPCYEPNPIKYLWTIRSDGYFQRGAGGHIPTYAAKISLTRAQFEAILAYIRPSRYCFAHYALMGPQCCTFVANIAAFAGVKLDCDVVMSIAPACFFRNMTIRLWEDPRYSRLTIATPDGVERSLKEAVERGEATYAL